MTDAKKALQTFCDSLVERPIWAILIKRDGEFLARVGDNAYVDPITLDYDFMVRLTLSHGFHELVLLDGTRQGNFLYSMNAGTEGVYIVVHLNDAYFVGISYKSFGVTSFDAVIESIHANFYALLDALYPRELNQ